MKSLFNAVALLKLARKLRPLVAQLYKTAWPILAAIVALVVDYANGTGAATTTLIGLGAAKMAYDRTRAEAAEAVPAVEPLRAFATTTQASPPAPARCDDDEDIDFDDLVDDDEDLDDFDIEIDDDADLDELLDEDEDLDDEDEDDDFDDEDIDFDDDRPVS